jgi:hypothetical protein
VTARQLIEAISPKKFILKMNQGGTGGEEVEEILRHLPRSFQIAHRRGREATWENPHPDEYDWTPIYNGDTWTEVCYYPDYSTEDGVLELIYREVDRDGNCDFADSAPVGSREAAQMEREYSYAGWSEHMKRYWTWVIDHGEDPLDYVIIPTQPTTDTWLIAFTNDNGRPKFARAKRLGQNPPEVASPDRARLPKAVEEYCFLSQDGHMDGLTWDELIAVEGVNVQGEEAVVRCEETINHIQHQGDALVQFIRTKAQEALDRLNQR